MERLGALQLNSICRSSQGNVKDRRSHPPVLVGGLISSHWPAQTVNLRQGAFLDAVTGGAFVEVTRSES